jgi:hypothetical protein
MRNRVTRQIITDNLDSYFPMKGGTLVSKIDFAHTAHIDSPDQIIVAELPFSMNMPVICQIVLLFLKNIEVSGSFPPWRKEVQKLDPGESRIVLDPPGTECHNQQPTIRVIWWPVCSNSLLTDVNTGSGDAPIAIVRSHDVNPGTNFDGARGDSLTSLGEASTRCRVDRDRTAIRRFRYDRIAIHA